MAKNRLLVNHEGDSIQLSWQPGQTAPRFTPAIPFEHPFDTKALSDLGWYLEQYLRYPYGIEPERATTIEQKFQDWGQQLFDLVFSRTEEAREFSQEATREGLEKCEIAIASDNPAVLNLPWELLYSPEHQFLAPLLAGIYRRVGNAHQAGVQTQIGEIPQDKLNILLVIARPYGEQDVAFKTIARPMLEALKPIRQLVNLKVLRPPSFQEFERELNANKGFYHIVHFDGHGTVNANGQGELVFETLFGTEQKITAEKIAQKLADCRVPVFVLNACKSAQQGEEKFSSVAAQLIFSGAKGVVAMAYSVYAEAAKQFMGGLYGELARGASLAEAVAAARRMVLNQPLRPSPKGNLPLQDWLVPVLYQQETYTPFTLAVNLKSEIQNPKSKIETVDLPEEGAYGFIGRDYDILRLERAFRKNHVGLLKGMGGVGKTELSLGFARWLDETQGRPGGIFFTSFEHGAGLSHVVNQIGRVLGGDEFSQLMPEQQQAVVLEYLQTHPCLLIWDNFEPVAGFPTGNESLLSDAERDNLKQFLQDLRGGKSWVLITSRREEPWLDCNYKRLALSGLSGSDVEELAAKILQRVGVDRRELPPEYLDLLKLLGGHPFCLRVVLPHLTTQSPTELMEALRLGFNTFQGAEEEGRDKSLYVSLDYSFAKLSERARRHLPFLAFFCERVGAELLAYLTNEKPSNPFTQTYLAIFGENLKKQNWLGILNEALDAGILENLGRSIYKIHPILPWYLRQQLAERHSQSVISELEIKLIDFYAGLAARHDQEMISNAQYATTILMIEEPNLLQNLRLAEQEQDWHSAQLILQAMGELYERQGRIAEFRVLRRRVLGVIGANLTDAKVKGRDALELWIHLRGIDANELSQYRDLDTAHQIYQDILNYLISLNDESFLDAIATLNHNIGHIAEQRRDFRNAAKYYKKALKFYEDVGESYHAAYEYFHLGVVEQNLENLEKSANYYNMARIIYENKNDLYMAAKVYYQLGRLEQDKRNIRKAISYYDIARKIHEDRKHLLELAPVYHHLGMAFQKIKEFEKSKKYYKQSLKICENYQNSALAARLYHQLGRLAHDKSNVEEAINYYQKAIQIFKEQNDLYSIAKTLTAWGETLEFQKDWTEALKIYVQALVVYTVSEQNLISLEDIRVAALGRILKVLGESRFQKIWRYVTGKDCPEKWLSTFQAPSEAQEE